MDRRQAIRAVGAAAVPLLLAQASAPASAALVPLSRDKWRLQTLQYGTVSERTSMIALRRTATPVAREFAHLELIEQRTAAMVLTNSATPTPPPLTPEQEAVIATLLASTTVDATYLTLQIQGHDKLLHIQSDYLAFDGDITDNSVHAAMLLRSNVVQHLRLLKSILAGAL